MRRNIGGYQIVSLEDKNITVGSGSVTVDGVFNAIKNSHRKPIYLADVKLDGATMSDGYVVPIVSSDITFTYAKWTFTITSANAVSVALTV